MGTKNVQPHNESIGVSDSGVNYVIIGASAAGIAAATRLRMFDAQATISVITQESTRPYNKCFLADYISGIKEQEALFLKSDTFFNEQRITLVGSTKIISIDAQLKRILSADGKQFSYDKLLIATGTNSFVPEKFKTLLGSGVFIFHTLEQITNIMTLCKKRHIRNVLVVGAGLSGLEAADALLTQFGCNVTVIDQAPHVLHSQLTEDASLYLEKRMQQVNVVFKGNCTVENIVIHNEHVSGVEFSDGNFQEIDIIVCAMGSRVDTTLLQASGITWGEYGIEVDDYLQTSVSDIFAAGDCIAITDLLTKKRMRSCMWSDAMQQGMIAADVMFEKKRTYNGSTVLISTGFFGLKCAISGSFKHCLFNSKTVLKIENDTCYHHVIVDDIGLVTGFLLLGDTQRATHLKRLIMTKTPYR